MLPRPQDMQFELHYHNIWIVLSPEVPFTEGVEYDDEDTVKAIVLLTDGENWLGNLNNHNKAYYNAYGW